MTLDPVTRSETINVIVALHPTCHGHPLPAACPVPAHSLETGAIAVKQLCSSGPMTPTQACQRPLCIGVSLGDTRTPI